jgi:hypothetical protein
VTQATCARCARPMPDTAYCCVVCAEEVRGQLAEVAVIAGEAAITVARQDRIGSGSSAQPEQPEPEPKNAGALYPTPLPFNPGAAAAYLGAVNDLDTWARHVHESSGRALPVARMCRHGSCWAANERWVLGPTCPHPDAVVALWLARQLDWLRYRQEANDAFNELTMACKRLVRIVDRPAQRMIVGQCGCGAYLYAVHGASTVKCRDCDTSYDVEASRDGLRQNLDERLLTAAEIALMAAYLGLTEHRDSTRKLVTQWALRGLIASHTNVGGEPAYLFGEVVTKLATSRRAA